MVQPVSEDGQCCQLAVAACERFQRSGLQLSRGRDISFSHRLSPPSPLSESGALTRCERLSAQDLASTALHVYQLCCLLCICPGSRQSLSCCVAWVFFNALASILEDQRIFQTIKRDMNQKTRECHTGEQAQNMGENTRPRLVVVCIKAIFSSGRAGRCNWCVEM